MSTFGALSPSWPHSVSWHMLLPSVPHRMRVPGLPSTLEELKAALADRYTLERELGAGGMATVYVAHDLRHNRKVAIKPRAADPGGARWREARTKRGH